MYKLGKIARKNLVGLLRSFNLQASKVNKRYADEPNFQPVPTYTIDEFMSNINNRADYRRETKRLERFFVKNRPDAQKKVIVTVGDEQYTVVNWMYQEQRNIRRAETAKRNRIKKQREDTAIDVGDLTFPPDIPSTPTTENFVGQQHQYADESLTRLVDNYISALEQNGWLYTEEGKKIRDIVLELEENFAAYLETIFYSDSPASTIEYVYEGGSLLSMGQVNYSNSRKIEEALRFWYEALEDSGY